MPPDELYSSGGIVDWAPGKEREIENGKRAVELKRKCGYPF